MIVISISIISHRHYCKKTAKLKQMKEMADGLVSLTLAFFSQA